MKAGVPFLTLKFGLYAPGPGMRLDSNSDISIFLEVIVGPFVFASIKDFKSYDPAYFERFII